MIQEFCGMIKFFLCVLLTLPIIVQGHSTGLVFHKTEETLAKVEEIISKKKKGCYLRFGDGDVYLALGRDDSYQDANHRLKYEMRETIRLNHQNIIKCLPLHCEEFKGWEPGMFPGNHESSYKACKQILTAVTPLWGAEIADVYSPVALHFLATTDERRCIQFLRYLRSSKRIILVGNENIPLEIRQLLFGVDSEFVPTPPQQSYAAMDRIENDCCTLLEDASDYTIVVTSMGCSGRVLQKRLWKKRDNIFLFDFGSLMDALCGWNTRAWIELSGFDKDRFLDNLRG